MGRDLRRGKRRPAIQHVEGRERSLIDAKPRAGVALRIEVDDEHAFANGGERRAEIDCRRRLANSALLIGESKNAHAA